MVKNESDNALALAPGAGSGIGKLIAERLLADPDFLPLMLQAAKDGLRAVRSYWDKDTRQMVHEPDNRVQIQTLFGLLSHMEGDPVKRVIHEFKKGGVDPLEALDSPAAVDAAERMIAGARAKLRRQGVKVGPKQVLPAEIEVAD
jgi:hypothetical protein